jgi:hypothetical protein
MASNKREMYAERKGRCEGRRWGGGVFRKQPRKTRGNRQNMNYTKNWGWKGGGGRGGRRDTEIIVLRY